MLSSVLHLRRGVQIAVQTLTLMGFNALVVGTAETIHDDMAPAPHKHAIRRSLQWDALRGGCWSMLWV